MRWVQEYKESITTHGVVFVAFSGGKSRDMTF